VPRTRLSAKSSSSFAYRIGPVASFKDCVVVAGLRRPSRWKNPAAATMRRIAGRLKNNPLPATIEIPRCSAHDAACERGVLRAAPQLAKAGIHQSTGNEKPVPTEPSSGAVGRAFAVGFANKTSAPRAHRCYFAIIGHREFQGREVAVSGAPPANQGFA